ncbi:MAG: phage major capsid protein [Oscillospiraceae bacterium]|jgi:hypothetical protein|nr:phage major capsid protein [Oscillospiraceae bacterium]
MNYENIKLEKGMYGIGNKSFTSVLENLDPSENYKGTNLEKLDAYQRQLKRFGIKVSGAGADAVEKFFGTSESAVLFPEYIARAVKQGITSNSVLPSVIAAKTIIGGIDYRTVQSSTDSQPSSNAVAEGAELRKVNVTTDPNLVKLIKHGRVFSSSYEAIRFQNLEVLTVILKKIGSDIASEQLEDVLAVISKDITMIDVSDSAKGKLSYNHLLQFWAELNPYKLNVMVASNLSVRDILAVSEMQDALAGLDFQVSGKLVTPLGAQLICAPSMKNSGIIYGFDKNCALQMIQSGGIIIDHDKIIDRQLERAAITVTAGFSKIFANSVKMLAYA